MLCGLYESVINAPLGSSIPGYFDLRVAAGVRDDLMARAAAFENDKGDSFIYVNMDTIRVIPMMTNLIRERVQQLTGVPGANIMVSSTHTHTGGPVMPVPVSGSPEESYTLWTAERAADTAVMAWNKRQPVKIGLGKASEDKISFIRRYYMKDGTFKTNPGFPEKIGDAIDRPAGEIDPEVGVIKIEAMDGTLLGVITNFACHLDTVGGYRFSADYPGELGRVLKSVYGKQVVSLFMTGACGNINHYDFIHRSLAYYTEANPPHYVRMGRMLAGDVIRALADTECTETDVLAVENDSFTAFIRHPSEESIAEAKAFLEEYPYAPFYTYEGVKAERPPFLTRRSSSRALLKVAEEVEVSDEVQIPVQVARIGDAVIAGMPCELFVEHGLAFKARSPYEHTFVSTVTNAHFGYIAVRESFEQGGYEATINGSTKMGPETGYDMVNTALSLLEKMQ